MNNKTRILLFCVITFFIGCSNNSLDSNYSKNKTLNYSEKSKRLTIHANNRTVNFDSLKYMSFKSLDVPGYLKELPISMPKDKFKEYSDEYRTLYRGCENDYFTLRSNDIPEFSILKVKNNKKCASYGQKYFGIEHMNKTIKKLEVTQIDNITFTQYILNGYDVTFLIEISESDEKVYLFNTFNLFVKDLITSLQVKNTYSNNGYDVNGFNKEGIHRLTQNEFDPDGYDLDGYNVRKFNKYGLHKITNRKGDEYGFQEDGFNGLGYDQFGFNRDGYNRERFHRKGIHLDTKTLYNVSGMDIKGYDIDGFNASGFNKSGIDRDGFNRAGFDKNGIHKITKIKSNQKGFDMAGFNKLGFNKLGFNRLGVNKDGYDIDGFKNGYNKNGYDINGYDINGLDTNGEKESETI